MRRLTAVAATTLAATPLQAHGALPGGGGFYAGLLHPFLAIEHLLLLIALGLLIGRPPRRPTSVPLIALAAGLGAGLAFGAEGVAWPGVSSAVLAGTALAGGVVALGLRLPVAALAALAATAGLGVGIDTGAPALSGSPNAYAVTPYAGLLFGVFLIVLNAMALAALTERPLAAIGMRVLGSWLVAAAVMVLALQLRGLGGPA